MRRCFIRLYPLFQGGCVFPVPARQTTSRPLLFLHKTRRETPARCFSTCFPQRHTLFFSKDSFARLFRPLFLTQRKKTCSHHRDCRSCTLSTKKRGKRTPMPEATFLKKKFWESFCFWGAYNGLRRKTPKVYTDSFARPFRLRFLRMFLPVFVDCRTRKP